MSSNKFVCTVIEGRAGASKWQPHHITARFSAPRGDLTKAAERRSEMKSKVVSRVKAHNEKASTVKPKDQTCVKDRTSAKQSGAAGRRTARKSSMLSRVAAHHERVKAARRPDSSAQKEHLLARLSGADKRRAELREKRIASLATHHQHVAKLHGSRGNLPKVAVDPEAEE